MIENGWSTLGAFPTGARRLATRYPTSRSGPPGIESGRRDRRTLLKSFVRRAVAAAGLIGPVLATIQLSSCTLILPGIEAARPDHVSLPAWQLRALGPGTPLVLVLRNGEQLQGEHAGFAEIPEAEYAAIYDAIREEQPSGLLLPALGDSVVVVDAYDRHLTCEFRGFIDPVSAWVRVEGERRPRGIPLVHVRQIRGVGGGSIRGDDLAALLSDGGLPIRTAILIDVGEDRLQFPMEEVAEVLVPARRKRVLGAMLAGAVVDVLLYLTVQSIGASPHIRPL
jgi:hypothetical protein